MKWGGPSGGPLTSLESSKLKRREGKKDAHTRDTPPLMQVQKKPKCERSIVAASLENSEWEHAITRLNIDMGKWTTK